LHDFGLALVVSQYKRRCVVRRIVSPPSLPRVVNPWSPHWTKHVPAKNKRAKVLHPSTRELIVKIDAAAFLAVHCTESPGPEEPLENLHAILSEGIVEALPQASAEPINGHTKTCNTDL
jgi:hypothetical protein